jgi:hypothetical protein
MCFVWLLEYLVCNTYFPKQQYSFDLCNKDIVADLQNCPPPKTAGQLRRFLGRLNFYRRFLPHAATAQAPLNHALSGPRIKGSHQIA